MCGGGAGAGRAGLRTPSPGSAPAARHRGGGACCGGRGPWDREPQWREAAGTEGLGGEAQGSGVGAGRRGLRASGKAARGRRATCSSNPGRTSSPSPFPTVVAPRERAAVPQPHQDGLERRSGVLETSETLGFERKDRRLGWGALGPGRGLRGRSLGLQAARGRRPGRPPSATGAAQ